MASSFYIVDDDRSVRKILSQIISIHFNNSEIRQSDDPWFAVQDIQRSNPDIVVLDLLMEGMDGIEVSEALIKNDFQGQIVMLSEVGSKEIIEQAYKAGVDHYINKPINVTEVVTVLSRTLEMHQLKNYIRLVGAPADSRHGVAAENGNPQKRAKLQKILKEVGILGESGSDELLFALLQLMNDMPLGQLYQWLKEYYPSYADDNISLKGIEQRLRRLVQLAMENIANIGVEDFSNYKFERYSTTLFSFKAIRQEMEYTRGNGQIRGKVDVKRFVDGLLVLTE